jgi:hypothetical protein
MDTATQVRVIHELVYIERGLEGVRRDLRETKETMIRIQSKMRAMVDMLARMAMDNSKR